MLNKNEMNAKANTADVDVDLLVAGIGEMLDGIRHCLKAADLHSSSTDSDYILMVAALPGNGIQVKDVTECFDVLKCFGTDDSVIQAPDCDLLMSYDERQVWCWMVGNIWSVPLSSMMWTVTVRTFL